MRANRSIPDCPVIPELPYEDVGVAADWLGAVFGFTVRVRIGDHRIQMNVGDGAVVLTQLRGLAMASQSALMVRVEDADRLHKLVLAADVEASAPTDYPYGERQFTVVDLGGHRWKFTQTIADTAPEDWGGESGKL